MSAQANSWPDRIHDALKETSNACRALWAARDRKAPASERVKLSQLADEAAARSNALQAECREAFSKSRGWRFNRNSQVHDLANDAVASNGAMFIDHAEFFDTINQRQVAMVTHTYAPTQEIGDYAGRRGYRAELLPFSWWNPGGCRAVVFTRKVGAQWPR